MIENFFERNVYLSRTELFKHYQQANDHQKEIMYRFCLHKSKTDSTPCRKWSKLLIDIVGDRLEKRKRNRKPNILYPPYGIWGKKIH
jgi:hypothetical protein